MFELVFLVCLIFYRRMEYLSNLVHHLKPSLASSNGFFSSTNFLNSVVFISIAPLVHESVFISPRYSRYPARYLNDKKQPIVLAGCHRSLFSNRFSLVPRLHTLYDSVHRNVSKHNIILTTRFASQYKHKPTPLAEAAFKTESLIIFSFHPGQIGLPLIFMCNDGEVRFNLSYAFYYQVIRRESLMPVAFLYCREGIRQIIINDFC